MQFGLSAFLTLLSVVPLWYLLRKDYVQGIAYSIFICVSAPSGLSIVMPGSLPQLTVYRLFVVSLFLYRLSLRKYLGPIARPMLAGPFSFWIVANLFSLVFTEAQFVVSLKRFLDFALETWVFYILISDALQHFDARLQLVRAAWLGLFIVALLAFVEKYTSISFVEFLLGSDEGAAEEIGADVVSTFSHRILLGAAMAMSWPLAFILLDARRGRIRHSWLWLSLAMFIGACYFSDSRGPWLGCGLSICVVGAAGGRSCRRKLWILAALTALVLLARPGVWKMLRRDAEVTINAESVKGRTFRYRLDLWLIAWDQITRSPKRFLFGTGQAYGLEANIEWTHSYSGRDETIWSWDNHFAYLLFTTGVCGFSASLCLYGGGVTRILRLARTARGFDRVSAVCLLASSLALLFMMSNVLIFDKKLYFLFWTLVAVALSPVAAASSLVSNSELARSSNEFTSKEERWVDLNPIQS